MFSYTARVAGALVLAFGITCLTSLSSAEEPHPLFDLEKIRSGSLQHMTVKDGQFWDEIYLYAPDQKTKIVDNDMFCGADEGMTKSEGHYFFILVRNNRVLSTFDLGAQFFVKELPWHGIDAYKISDRNYLRIFRYMNCRLGGGGASSLFFVSDDKIRQVSFVMLNGNRRKEMIDLDLLKDGHLESIEGSYRGNGGEGKIYYHIFRSGSDSDDYDLYEAASWGEPEPQ